MSHLRPCDHREIPGGPAGGDGLSGIGQLLRGAHPVRGRGRFYRPLLVLSSFYLTRIANTINMKWITKEPPTLFFDGILTNSQLFCAFIKVPLQPYSLYWGYAAIFLRIHSLSSAIHQLSSKIWYSIIVAWR